MLQWGCGKLYKSVDVFWLIKSRILLDNSEIILNLIKGTKMYQKKDLELLNSAEQYAYKKM